MKKESISTNKAPAAIGPYSQAVTAGDFVFTSGQIPNDKNTKMIAGEGIEEQAHMALTNLEAVLEAAGAGLDSVIKTTVFLKDMGDFAAMNKVYGAYFSEDCPARSCVEVSKLPLGVRIEVEAVALKK